MTFSLFLSCIAFVSVIFLFLELVNIEEYYVERDESLTQFDFLDSKINNLSCLFRVDIRKNEGEIEELREKLEALVKSQGCKIEYEKGYKVKEVEEE